MFNGEPSWMNRPRHMTLLVTFILLGCRAGLWRNTRVAPNTSRMILLKFTVKFLMSIVNFFYNHIAPSSRKFRSKKRKKERFFFNDEKKNLLLLLWPSQFTSKEDCSNQFLELFHHFMYVIDDIVKPGTPIKYRLFIFSFVFEYKLLPRVEWVEYNLQATYQLFNHI